NATARAAAAPARANPRLPARDAPWPHHGGWRAPHPHGMPLRPPACPCAGKGVLRKDCLACASSRHRGGDGLKWSGRREHHAEPELLIDKGFIPLALRNQARLCTSPALLGKGRLEILQVGAAQAQS